MYNRLVSAAGDLEEGYNVTGQLDKECLTSSIYSSVLTRYLMPSFGRAFELAIRANADVRCARIALAVERYRIEKGNFPQTLDQLVPEYMEAIPQDPFDHQPMRYRVAKDYVVIYSVGEDMHDDGGKVERLWQKKDARDCGFMLLTPEIRGRPYTGKPLYELFGTTTAPST